MEFLELHPLVYFIAFYYRLGILGSHSPSATRPSILPSVAPHIAILPSFPSSPLLHLIRFPLQPDSTSAGPVMMCYYVLTDSASEL